MPTLLIPKEVHPGETRVAATPDTVKRLCKRGFQVLLQKGAGLDSSISDQAYEEAGAKVREDLRQMYQEADIVAKLHPPTDHPELQTHEVSLLRSGTLFISFLWPTVQPSLAERLQNQGVTAFAMDQIPRISRAQSMDALSSQSNIAGYKAALLAANALPKLLPLMMTAAGTIKPAKFVIMGAGVAGLQAIATAKRLGALVEVSDIRPAVKEQVESLGAKFIDVPSNESLEDAGGYAKEVSADFLQRQQAIVRKHVVAADAVITTALVPGKKAPRLITKDMVEEMRSGTVIVDLAAEQGGNCELTVADQTTIHNGVTIVGTTNVPALLPKDASEMYARNILTVLQHLSDKEGNIQLDWEDEITTKSIITHGNKLRHEATRTALGLAVSATTDPAPSHLDKESSDVPPPKLADSNTDEAKSSETKIDAAKSSEAKTDETQTGKVTSDETNRSEVNTAPTSTHSEEQKSIPAPSKETAKPTTEPPSKTEPSSNKTDASTPSSISEAKTEAATPASSTTSQAPSDASEPAVPSDSTDKSTAVPSPQETSAKAPPKSSPETTTTPDASETTASNTGTDAPNEPSTTSATNTTPTATPLTSIESASTPKEPSQSETTTAEANQKIDSTDTNEQANASSESKPTSSKE